MKQIAHALILGFCLMLAACTEADPGTRIEEFIKVVANGELSKTLGFYSPRLIKSLEESQKQRIVNSLGAITNQMKADGGLQKMSTSSEVQGEVATVNATATFGNGKTSTNTFRMIKIDGKWYLPS